MPQLRYHERSWVIDPLGTPRNYASYKFVRFFKPSNKAVAQLHSRSLLQLAEIVVARYVNKPYDEEMWCVHHTSPSSRVLLCLPVAACSWVCCFHPLFKEVRTAARRSPLSIFHLW